MSWMKTRIGNWSRTHSSHPEKIERPRTVESVANILRNPKSWPSPVRAMGNYHSTTACVNSEGGTVLDMKRMKDILHIDDHHVRVQAGALYQDVTRELNKKGLNFPVNLQVGNVTVGSVACCATKDGSYPGVYGQAGAYVTHIRLVRTDGTVEDIDETQPELFAAVRSSYGLMGVIVEVTFKVVKLKPVSVRHETYSFERFLQLLPELKAQQESIELYIFPITDRITVQFRGPATPNTPNNRWAWWIRNTGVQHGMPVFTRLFRLIPFKSIRYACIHFVDAIARKVLVNLVHAGHTNPAEQTTNYAHRPWLGAFTFSIWAFPEDEYPSILLEYQKFCREYYDQHGYQPDMLTVGYRVIQSQHSLLSYSHDGNVMTIDPVAVGSKDWRHFAEAFNDFAVAYGGKPLMNQTPHLRSDQLDKAFGQQWTSFKEYREKYDPENRLLNSYFESLL